MDKEAWLKAKIEKIMAEGVNGKPVSPEQAVAIANSMWEEMQKTHATKDDTPPLETPVVKDEPPPPVVAEEPSTFARMPIFPAKAGSKAVDGREITQEMIDAILRYDPKIRPAIIKLDAKRAHGEANGPAVGKLDRTYVDGELIYADIRPTKGWELALPDLAGPDGPYANRSIELDTLLLNDEKQLYLESVALCGAERPALNLPAAEFSKQTFTVSLTGGTMAEKPPETEPEVEKKPEPTYGVVVPIEKELANIKADFAKRDSINTERIAELESKLMDKDLDVWSKNPKMIRKLPSFARVNAVNIIKAAMERKSTMNFQFAKEMQEIPLGEAIKNLLESLPDTLIATRTIGDNLPTVFDVPMDRREKELIAVSKIRQYAAAKNIDLTTPEGYTKAEAAVKKDNPDLWEVA